MVVCLQLLFMGVSRFKACSLGVRIGRFWILGFRIEGLVEGDGQLLLTSVH